MNGLKVTTCDSHGNIGEDVIQQPRQKWPDGPCYLAGPMRRLPEFNFPAFFDAEWKLREQHAEVGMNPARHDVEVMGFDFHGKTGHEDLAALGFDLEASMQADLAYIRDHAEWVCVLPGWETSSGSKGEIAEAAKKGIPILSFPSGEPVKFNWPTQPGPPGGLMVDTSTVVPVTPILEPGQLCTQASAIVSGARRKAYGPPEDNFRRIAILHDAWDKVLATVPDGSIGDTVNVAVRMILMKLARIAESPDHTDSWRDAAGYADCGARCAKCDPSK